MADMTYMTPLSEDFRNNREALYKKLRDESPVFMTEQGAVISRFDDVYAVCQDPMTFSSAGLRDVARPKMGSMDPPEHGIELALMKSAFDKKYQDGLEETLRTLARSLITKAAAGTECDLIKDLVTPYFLEATGVMLGLSVEQLEDLHMIDHLVPLIFTNDPEVGPVTLEGILERADALFTVVLEEHRANPRNDHTSALLAVGADSARAMTQIELLEYLFRFRNGNSLTSAVALGNGIELLARHPEARAELAANPALIPNAYMEMQRLEPPTLDANRITTREVVVAGVTLPANTVVRINSASANLDDRKFADPGKFDIHRDASGQLAMLTGEHYCFGAYMACLESRIFLEELLTTMPNFTPSGPPIRLKSLFYWGFESVPVSIP